jgi:hypothetical protein
MSTITEPTTPTTPEEAIFARYIELSEQIKSLEAERDGIKTTELIPAMSEDGLQFSFNGQYARFEFRESVSFDYKRARAEGKISDEIWQEYTSVQISRSLYVRKIKDDAQLQNEQQILVEMAAIAKDNR